MDGHWLSRLLLAVWGVGQAGALCSVGSSSSYLDGPAYVTSCPLPAVGSGGRADWLSRNDDGFAFVSSAVTGPCQSLGTTKFALYVAEDERRN